MQAEKEDNDYYIFLNEKEIKRACSRSFKSPSGLKYYPWLYSEVLDRLENKITKEILALQCTRDAFTLSDLKTHDYIYFNFEEEGPTIKIFTPVLASILHSVDFLITRYNAESKIWIYRE